MRNARISAALVVFLTSLSVYHSSLAEPSVRTLTVLDTFTARRSVTVSAIRPFQAPTDDTKPTIDLLARRILSVPSHGKALGVLEETTAHTLAAAIVAHCADILMMDHYAVGALAWVESGYRTAAVSPSGRHFGFFQVDTAYDAMNIEVSTAEACRKLRAWYRYCRISKGHKGHDPLVHWFAGNIPNSRALIAVDRVRVRARILRARHIERNGI